MVSDVAHKPEREKWWFWLWTTWGVICGAIIGVADHSMMSGLAWVGGAALFGLIGERLFRLLCAPFFAIASRQLAERAIGLRRESDAPAAVLGVYDQAAMDMIDPSRKPWASLPGIVVMMAILFGITGGGFVGALAPWTAVWQGTALTGALWGIALGPLAFAPLFAIVMTCAFASIKGPRVDSMRAIVDEACREAERRGHEHLLPGHLLMAVFRAAAPRVYRLTDCSAESLETICLEIDGELVAYALPNDPEDAMLASAGAHEALQTAIDEAKSLKQPRVEAGHLLLGLLATWPSGTSRALTQLGIDPVEPREDLRERLRRAA